MSKVDYIRQLLSNRKPLNQLTEAAVIFYHCGIDILEAGVYMDNLEAKLKEKNRD